MGGRSGGRDELSRALRELRQVAQLSTRAAAQQTGFSAAKISRVERGINVPTETDVAALVHAYQAPPDVRTHLTSIARDIRTEHRPVVMARGKGHPSAFQERLARIEATTEHLTTFTPTVVPGLLQTETYMRALVAYRELPPAEVDKFVAARLARQERLEDPAHRFTQITTEGALGWRAGSPADMAEQVDRIVAVSRLPSVRVGIIAWGTQAPVFPLHGWDLHDERAVIYGTADATAVLTEPRDVARYVTLTAAVEEIAIWGDAARTVLSRISDRYRASATSIDRRRSSPVGRSDIADHSNALDADASTTRHPHTGSGGLDPGGSEVRMARRSSLWSEIARDRELRRNSAARQERFARQITREAAQEQHHERAAEDRAAKASAREQAQRQRRDNLAAAAEQTERLDSRSRELSELLIECVHARVTRRSRDEGIDGVLFDCNAVLGGEYIVQAKRYREVVPANDVRALAGVLHDKRANHAVFVTPSWFSDDGRRFAADNRVRLIEGPELKHLLHDHLNLEVIIPSSRSRR